MKKALLKSKNYKRTVQSIIDKVNNVCEGRARDLVLLKFNGSVLFTLRHDAFCDKNIGREEYDRRYLELHKQRGRL